MDFTISEEHERLRSAFRQFILREALPAVQESERNEYGGLPEDFIRRLVKRSVELGFYTLEMPEEYGGIDLGILGVALMVEEYHRHFPGFEAGPRLLGGGPTGPHKMFLKFTEAQKQKYFLPLLRGEKFTAFALTEPNAGSDNQGMTTTAVKQ